MFKLVSSFYAFNMLVLQKQKNRGFTLIEVLVATFLISIIFLGIFGGFQLAIKVVAQSRVRMHAVYLASQRIEEIRSLPFSQIQTGESAVSIGGALYYVQTLVEEIDDCADGTIEGFDCSGFAVLPDTAPNDYKRVKVRVSWQEYWGGEMSLSTNVAAKGLETGEGKGALRIAVSDSFGQPLEILTADQLPPCPANAIRITNQNTGLDQCYGTDINNPGVRLLILNVSVSPDDYKIIINKEGYGSEQTFRTGDIYNSKVIANPLRKNPTLSQGQLYPITFIIDKLSNFNIFTLAPWGGDSFFDTFWDESKVSEINNLFITNQTVILSTSSPGIYFDSGYLFSDPVSPSQITEWHQLSWSDFEEMGTDIGYQIFYATSSTWKLVPESDLPGNAAGFDSSPVDLSGLNPNKFSGLKIKTNFWTNDLSKTPILYDWRLSWKDSQATAIANVSFWLRGNKTVGTDQAEQPIYKYLANSNTDFSGQKQLLNLEADNYLFFNFEKNGGALDLNTALSLMPVNLLPGTTTAVYLYLEAENSLLVKVEDASSTQPVFGATVELSRSTSGYFQSQTTDQQGETLFIPLSPASDYSLKVQATDYYEESYIIGIWGREAKYVTLERYE